MSKSRPIKWTKRTVTHFRATVGDYRLYIGHDSDDAEYSWSISRVSTNRALDSDEATSLADAKRQATAALAKRLAKS